jgi:hypothetical protein
MRIGIMTIEEQLTNIVGYYNGAIDAQIDYLQRSKAVLDGTRVEFPDTYEPLDRFGHPLDIEGEYQILVEALTGN